MSNSTIGFGVNNGSTDIDIRHSYVLNAGDGIACPGCAQPSIWVSNSSNVRIVDVGVLNNGVGPEGDGEIACYNSPDLLLQDSTVKDVGASGLYLVNCDNALVLNNVIENTREWGLDIVDSGFASGSDYGLYDGNVVRWTRSGAGVILNSRWNTFSANSFEHNRLGPGASGSCDGLNVRGNSYTGLIFFPTFFTSSPYLNNDGSICSD